MATKADIFPSKYMHAGDLAGRPLVVKIQSAEQELLKSPDGKEQNKTVLCFVGQQKMLPLNLTNWDSVAEIAGDDTVDWPGKAIEIYPTRTTMGAKLVDCIRIRPPTQRGVQLQKSKPTPAQALVQVDDGMSDDIPFAPIGV